MSRLVLDSDDPDRVVYFLSEDLRWNLRRVIHADPEKMIPKESIYVTQDKTTGIHAVTDPLVHMVYLVVRGPHANEVTKSICDSTSIIDQRAAIRMMEEAHTRQDRMRAVACVGVTAPEAFDRASFELLQSAFQDPDPEVRKVAAWVTVYAAWPELRSLLERMRDHDPSVELRDDATRLLTAFERQSLK